MFRVWLWCKFCLGYGCGLHASGWAVGCCGYMGVGVDMMELGCG